MKIVVPLGVGVGLMGPEGLLRMWRLDVGAGYLGVFTKLCTHDTWACVCGDHIAHPSSVLF